MSDIHQKDFEVWLNNLCPLYEYENSKGFTSYYCPLYKNRIAIHVLISIKDNLVVGDYCRFSVVSYNHGGYRPLKLPEDDCKYVRIPRTSEWKTLWGDGFMRLFNLFFKNEKFFIEEDSKIRWTKTQILTEWIKRRPNHLDCFNILNNFLMRLEEGEWSKADEIEIIRILLQRDQFNEPPLFKDEVDLKLNLELDKLQEDPHFKNFRSSFGLSEEDMRKLRIDLLTTL